MNESRSTQERIESAIADYLRAVESGQVLDDQEWLAQHDDLADELTEFLQHHRRLQSNLAARGEPDELAAREAATLCNRPDSTKSIDADTLPWENSFGDYELVEEISRGGMGIVYRARHARLNRTVALKLMRAGDLASEEEVHRFYGEAKAAASLDHPAIVPIYDVGQHQGRHFLSMRLVEGITLSQRLAEGPLQPEEAAALIRKIAEAMTYAHEHGVVHRDLKPANVLLDRSGEPMVTDFGLAKNLNADANLTATGQILGTPGFMAPEQAKGDCTANQPIVDVYGIGAILYAMCTGSAPFQATNQIDVVIQVLDREPQLPSKLNRRIPKALEQICLRCLEKKPENRYPSAQAIVDDVDRFLKGEPLEAGSASLLHRIRRWSGREPALVSHLVGIISTVLVVVGAFLTIGSEWSYFLRHVGVLAGWAAICVLLQQFLNRSRSPGQIRVIWSGVDVLCFTCILYMAEPPRGPLLIGYPLLVTAVGLFNRVSLVVFTTLLSVVGFITLMVVSPGEINKPHFCVIFTVALLVLGGIVSAIVRRLQMLRQYCEKAG